MLFASQEVTQIIISSSLAFHPRFPFILAAFYLALVFFQIVPLLPSIVFVGYDPDKNVLAISSLRL